MAMQWRPGNHGAVGCVDWSDWLGTDRHVDPYLVWADLTGFAGLRTRGDGDDTLSLIVELEEGTSLSLSGESGPTPCDCSLTLAQLTVAGAYRRSAQPKELRSRFFTARCSPATIAHLLLERRVKRFQLGLPRIPRDVSSEPLARGTPPTGGQAGQRTVVGFIDDGCAFAHPNFLADDGGPRVAWLWDQSAARRVGDKWSTVSDFTYGAELTPAALRSVVLAHTDTRGPYEAADYVPVRPDPDRHATAVRGSGIPYGTMLWSTHGTAVMDLAVGRHVDGVPQRWQAGLRVPEPSAPEVDTAVTCPIVFVQLPTQSVLDTSGGSLAVHVLDGVRYILERSRSFAWFGDGDRAKDFPNRVIVNISYGAIAGSHDGSSILELALDELQRNEIDHMCWIVVAAGNAHQARTHVHADLAPGEFVPLLWQVGPDNPHEAFLEVWVPDADIHGKAIAEPLGANLIVGVFPPDGDPLPCVTMGSAHLLHDDRGDEVVAGVVFARKVAQGLRGTMVLVAVAPTRIPLAGAETSRRPAPHGRWRVEVTLDGAAVAPVRLHAWTERNDLVYGNLRPQQTSVRADAPMPEPTEFTGEALAFTRKATPGWLTTEHMPRPFQADAALSTIGGMTPSKNFAQERPGFMGAVVVVGSHRISDGEIAAYSSGGPGRALDADQERELIRYMLTEGKRGIDPQAPRARVQPDVDAAGDLGAAARGLRVAGLIPGRHARLTGTSAAAPAVTRFLADTVHRNSLESPLVLEDSSPVSRNAAARRGVISPGMDDLFRRGRQRLK